MKQGSLRFRRGACLGLAALLMAWLAFVLSFSVVVAHALLVKSEPEEGAVLVQPPEQVTLWFSQELGTKQSTLRVFNAAEEQVDNGDGGVDLYDPDHATLVVSLPESLPDGRYIVRWRAVSGEDGDFTEGEFTFSVGPSGASASQVSASETSPANDGPTFPFGLLALIVGALVLVIIGLILSPRLRRNN